MLDPLVQLSQYVSGHVYTRMIHKAATAYGTLKEHHIELAIIEELLNQTYWRKGKRATWYERRALILEKYISADYELIKNGILQALADDFTGISMILHSCFDSFFITFYSQPARLSASTEPDTKEDEVTSREMDQMRCYSEVSKHNRVHGQAE